MIEDAVPRWSGSSRWTRLQIAACVVHATALIATPLRRRGRRAGLAEVVIATLGCATAAATARRWGPTRAATTATALAGTTALIEQLGTSTGIPFGRYTYTGTLRPTVRAVPAIVPVAWFAMALPAREVAHGALGERSTVLRRIGAGALCLTAWDLFLDPQMVGEGYWRWARCGRYRGIPLTNYIGWLLTSALVMAMLEVLVPPGSPEVTLIGEYGWMAAMQTLGFAAFFDDRVVALVGGAAMVPPAVIAAARQFSAGRSSAVAHPLAPAGG